MATELKYYNYIYAHPLTGNIFYVGKGCKNRDIVHLRDVRNHKLPNGRNYPLYLEIKEILSEDMEPIILRIFECYSSKEAFSNEIKLIERYKNEGHILLNLTKGGDGFDSESVSQSSKNRWSNPEFKVKMSKIIKAAQNTDKCRTQRRELSKKMWENPEHRMNMMEKMKIAQNLPERKNKQSKISKEFSNRIEVKNRVSKESSERWKNPEFKKIVSKKISEGLTNNPKVIKARKIRWLDPNYKEKMSSMMKAKWQDPEYLLKMKIRNEKMLSNEYRQKMSRVVTRIWQERRGV